LCEHWRRGDDVIDSCAIITTDANDLMRDIHDRMPVILSPHDYDLWLDNEFDDRRHLESMLRPHDADEMIAYPVSTLVNSPRNDSPKCIEPTQPMSPPRQGELF
jgi:putative SOS response-associated peptidase YedK